MSVCPKCHKEIKTLIAWEPELVPYEVTESDGSLDWEPLHGVEKVSLDEIETEFSCPECDFRIATSQLGAILFLQKKA